MVTGVKIHFPGHGRHTKAVAVVADAFYHPFQQVLGALALYLTEPQRVECSYRAGAHGKNITVDTPHTCSRTLVGLYCAGVVMALDLEGTGQSVPDINQSGVLLARLHQQVLAFAGQLLQVYDGVLVAAVLRPHHRVNTQFRKCGYPAQDGFDLIKFFRQESQFAGNLHIYNRFFGGLY